MKHLKKTWFDYFLVLFFVMILIVTLYPFLNVLAISFNDATDTLRNVNFIIPRQFTLYNYNYVFKEGGILMPLLLSIAKTVVGTVVGVISTAMLAYVLSRRDFVFQKLFTIMFVITMYVGGGLIPEYLLIMRTLKLGNNFLVYILPGLIWVYNMILVRSFIEGLPLALQEAARVDGATERQCFWYVIFPNLKGSLYTITVLSFLNSFKVFREAYLVAGSYPHESMYLLQHLFNNWFVNLELDKMAASAVCVGAVLFAVILLLQRLWDNEEKG